MRTTNSFKRIYREVASCLSRLTPAAWEILWHGTSQEQRYILWLAVCKRYAFIRDFATSVVHEKYLRLDYTLTYLDYDIFLMTKRSGILKSSGWSTRPLHPPFYQARNLMELLQLIAEKKEVADEVTTVYAILDKYPVTQGHALVIPKQHVADYFQLSERSKTACWLMVDRVQWLLNERFQPDGFNVGTAAGQTIPHVHIHVMPRYVGDTPNPTGGVRHVMPGKGDYTRA